MPTNFINDLLHELEKKILSKRNIAIEVNHCLSFAKDEILVDQGCYQLFVDTILYLTHTRPDLAYAMSISINLCIR